ncbi:peptide/nickel transport system permease protein [Faunimonas pinastri]|uniref:Peptide/nickel transport system permease protein n=1 Tax=Faunimonas pinastri TaxID=1855383 RepID=A0A1H9B6D1_9HYPH|nr:ABC transporter permease [Faunimonas pinastri]SEP84261.1 peptide/nickel transport system permease protein [Faunimonas pinastri]
MNRLVRAFGGPTGLIGGAIVVLVIAMALLAPAISPFDPDAVALDRQLTPPDLLHWFGTDQSGRDILSRVIWGARPSLEIGIGSVLVSILFGLPLGLVAGFNQGSWVEQVIMRTLDAVAAIPTLIWAIAVVGILGVGVSQLGPLAIGNQTKVTILLGLLYIPGLARIIYVATLVEAQADYVAARRLQGVPGWKILFSDVLPNTLSPVIVHATLQIAVGIILEAAISFVGLGVQPPAASWGNMLAASRNFVFSGEWWLSVFPGLFISITVIGFNLMGDGIRDVLDPRRKLTMAPA